MWLLAAIFFVVVGFYFHNRIKPSKQKEKKILLEDAIDYVIGVVLHQGLFYSSCTDRLLFKS